MTNSLCPYLIEVTFGGLPRFKQVTSGTTLDLFRMYQALMMVVHVVPGQTNHTAINAECKAFFLTIAV